MKNEFINPDPQWKGVKKNYFPHLTHCIQLIMRKIKIKQAS